MWAIIACPLINLPLPDRQTQLANFLLPAFMGTLRSQPEAVMEHLVRVVVRVVALCTQVKAMHLWVQTRWG